ncbi:MAG: hypothetical protein IIC50_20935 [Planctomycetes bacterium]|nr:hypothetical protein [Planctomycetota bacterium]
MASPSLKTNCHETTIELEGAHFMPEAIKRRGDYEARVTHNRQLGKLCYRLGLEFSGDAARLFATFQPGQFVQLEVTSLALPPADKIPAHLQDQAWRHVMLRRPFSLCSVSATPTTTTIDIIYYLFGPATLRMITLEPGHRLRVLGPLGNSFAMPENKQTALLVAGGVGAPPIQHLATELAARDAVSQIVLFAGSKTIDDLAIERQDTPQGVSLPDLEAPNIAVHIATDDGSAGHHGFVTDCLVEWLQEHGEGPTADLVLYGCGPEPMLRVLAAIASRNKIDCQVSLERYMGCGMELCQSCVVEIRTPQQTETIYKLCCLAGPVFDAREVVFEEAH